MAAAPKPAARCRRRRLRSTLWASGWLRVSHPHRARRLRDSVCVSPAARHTAAYSVRPSGRRHRGRTRAPLLPYAAHTPSSTTLPLPATPIASTLDDCIVLFVPSTGGLPRDRVVPQGWTLYLGVRGYKGPPETQLFDALSFWDRRRLDGTDIFLPISPGCGHGT